MINSHYVPMQTLRKFGEKLCIFNVCTGEYLENAEIKKLFSEKGFYSYEIEEKLGRKIEQQFGYFSINKLMKSEKTIELSRKEIELIKKFLLISVIRSMGSEEFMKKEQKFYRDLQTRWLAYAKEKKYVR